MLVLLDHCNRTVDVEEGSGMVAQIPIELADIAVQWELPDRVLELLVQNEELFHADEPAVELI